MVTRLLEDLDRCRKLIIETLLNAEQESAYGNRRTECIEEVKLHRNVRTRKLKEYDKKKKLEIIQCSCIQQDILTLNSNLAFFLKILKMRFIQKLK